MNLGIAGLAYVELIGRGGFGAVYRVRDEAHGRDLAVKILPAPLDDSARRQFDRERRAMGVLSGHPNIGTVHTSGFTANDEPYIAMELLRGGSLANRLESGPLPVGEVLQIGAAVADALAVAHETGVLHLDVKPENILFSEFGSPKLVDFGIAALADDERYTSTIRATPAYAAPEILDGHPATPAADVYGLAVTLYALLMGTAPYAGDSMLTVLRRIAVEPVPEVYRPDTPPSLVSLLRRAMGKSPIDRPASMREFADALRSIDPNERAPHATAPGGAPVVLPPPPGDPGRAAPAETPPPATSGPVTAPPVPPVGTPPGGPGRPGSPSSGGRRALIAGGVAAAILLAVGAIVVLTRGGEEGGTRSVTTRTTVAGRTTQPVVTAPPVTDPPVTDPPVTDPPVTDPPVTEPPVTDPPPDPPPDPAGIGIADVRWALELDENFEPVEVAVVVPDGSPEICLTWTFTDAPVGADWTISWSLDQEPQPNLDGAGQIDTPSDLFYACVSNTDGVIPGTYEMTWSVAGETALVDAIYVGGGRVPVELQLVNASERDLCEAYVSPTAAESWGVNSLFLDPLVPGVSRTIPVASGAYDVRVVDCDGADVFVRTDGSEYLADEQLVVSEP